MSASSASRGFFGFPGFITSSSSSSPLSGHVVQREDPGFAHRGMGVRISSCPLIASGMSSNGKIPVLQTVKWEFESPRVHPLLLGGVVQSAEHTSLKRRGWWFESTVPLFAHGSGDLSWLSTSLLAGSILVVGALGRHSLMVQGAVSKTEAVTGWGSIPLSSAKRSWLE